MEAAAALPEFLDVRVGDVAGGGLTVLFPASSTVTEPGCLNLPSGVEARAGMRFTRGSGRAA